MRGDFSRIRSNRNKHYSAVLEQQGRVALDADANEQSAIDAYLRETADADIIGRYGGPVGNAGFRIVLDGARILIGPGRYYVDGILVENPGYLSFDDQPYLDHLPSTARELLFDVIRGDGLRSVQFTLEVWERFVTALDDPCLLEPALGQADTTARLQTVWRVVATISEPRVYRQLPDQTVALPVQGGGLIYDRGGQGGCSNAADDPIARLSPCCQLLYDRRDPPRTGAMGADTVATDDCGCQPIPAAGYQGLENQLYRVEIHHPGDLHTATFKWSRENGSVVTQVTDVNGATLTVSSLGPDANLGYQSGQWVELSDDRYLFARTPNRPGLLYQILSVQPSSSQVTLTLPVTGIDTSRNARMRRWDQAGAAATASGVPLSKAPTQLENGIEVTFHKGDYVSGDYWTIPARTADGQIDWPPCGGDGRFFQPADFTPIHAAPLACVHRRDDGYQEAGLEQANPGLRGGDGEKGLLIDERLFRVDDCRLLFPPLTALCGSAEPAALHVQSISWTNDSIMSFDQLVANGLLVTFDQAPAGPVSGASVSVTFEVATPAASVKKDPAVNPNNVPSTVVRVAAIVDSYVNITLKGTALAWSLPFDPNDPAQTVVLLYLDELLSFGAPAGWFARVRVRLLGRAIYANGANDLLYLDGQAFGQPGTRADGSACVGLQFPSGAGEKASDFESWFYLAPLLVLVSVTVQYASITIETNADGSLSLYTGDGELVTPQATVTVNYPVVAATTITLVLQYPAAYPDVVEIPSTIEIPLNGTQASFPITALSNPGNSDPAQFQILASLAAAVGPGSSASASFGVTGIPPQQQIQ